MISLTVASFNFRGSDEEVQYIISECLLNKVNILCIQGGCKANYDLLIRETNSNGYKYVRMDDNFKKNTGELIFTTSRKDDITLKVDKALFTGFRNTSEDRALSRYDITIDSNVKISICTSELETTIVNRRLQIDEIVNSFKTNDKVIFVGNTNIPEWQRDIHTPKGWFDAWEEKGTSSNYKTFEKDRLDRFYYKGLYCDKFSLLEGKNYDGVMATFSL